MRVESSILVGDQQIGLSMDLLEPHQCERAAATIAWFTLQSLDGDVSADPATWQAFVESVIFVHVAFEVPDDQLEHLGLEWWSEAAGLAMAEFVRTNTLMPAVTRYIETIAGASSAGPYAA